MARMTLARHITELLDGYGVSHVFFTPTILSQALTEMERHTGIRRIMTHGEKAAAYMADGYARASGRPGICMAQTVGAANLAAGLRDACLAGSPVIALTGGPYPHTRHRHYYQQTDDMPLFRPLTKFSAEVTDPALVPEMLRQAFRAATTGAPGPAHLQLMGHEGDIENQEIDLPVVAEERFARVPPFRPVADDESIAAAARLLAQAARPIIVAGGGVRASGAGAELVRLAEHLAIPLATSLNAKDTVPGDHPLAVGVPGLYCRKSANRAVLEADLVFFVGSRTGSQVTHGWQVPPLGTPVIQLDIEAAELGRHYPNRVSLLGDARRTLARLVELADSASAAGRGAWVERARALVGEWRQEASALMASDAVPIRPERICRELSDLLPSDALLVSCTGHSGMWTGGMVDLAGSGQGYIRAAGSLGWGFPGALGVKLAVGDRPVLLFTGDGGFWYHIGELETAVRWNIAAVILVNNNRSLNQEIPVFARTYGGTLEGRHGELWQFRDTDFAALARAVGAEGIRVERPAELAGALDRAFACGRPCVVDVVTEIEALAPKAFTYE